MASAARPDTAFERWRESGAAPSAPAQPATAATTPRLEVMASASRRRTPALTEMQRRNPRAAGFVAKAQDLRVHGRRILELSRLAETTARRYHAHSNTADWQRLGLGVTIRVDEPESAGYGVVVDLLTTARHVEHLPRRGKYPARDLETVLFVRLSACYNFEEDGSLYLDVLDAGGEDLERRARELMTPEELVLYMDAATRLLAGARLLGLIPQDLQAAAEADADGAARVEEARHA